MTTEWQPIRLKKTAAFLPPIVLDADDKPAFPSAPEGFDKERANIPHGAMQIVTYHSTTVGVDRYMLVYTPPGYAPTNSYPALYFPYGIGGDEHEWERIGVPNIILDNLLDDKKIKPMIVVMPNGRARENDRPDGNIYSVENIKAFANFESDLLHDIIPYVESHYTVLPNAENRALAGRACAKSRSNQQ